MLLYKALAVTALATGLAVASDAGVKADEVLFSQGVTVTARNSDPCVAEDKGEVISVQFVPGSSKNSDPCTVEEKPATRFVNFMPPGNRGSEGRLTEELSKFLSSRFQNKFFRFGA